MSKEEAIGRLYGLLQTYFVYNGYTEGGAYWQKEVDFKNDNKYYADAIETVLQLLEQKENIIKELEDETYKMSEYMKEIATRRNNAIDKLKQDIRENEYTEFTIRRAFDFKKRGALEEAREILKILEE